MREIIQDEVILERTDEDLMIVTKNLVALCQANILNLSLLNEKITEAKLTRKKLQDEIISLKKEVKKRKKWMII